MNQAKGSGLSILKSDMNILGHEQNNYVIKLLVISISPNTEGLSSLLSRDLERN